MLLFKRRTVVVQEWSNRSRRLELGDWPAGVSLHRNRSDLDLFIRHLNDRLGVDIPPGEQVLVLHGPAFDVYVSRAIFKEVYRERYGKMYVRNIPAYVRPTQGWIP